MDKNIVLHYNPNGFRLKAGKWSVIGKDEFDLMMSPWTLKSFSMVGGQFFEDETLDGIGLEALLLKLRRSDVQRLVMRPAVWQELEPYFKAPTVPFSTLIREIDEQPRASHEC